MKKVLFAFASAILALTSCSNESELLSPNENAGKEVMTTISVGMAPKTRATIDNDGAAAHVNRCILEVRTGDSKRVYRHVEVSVDPATLTATFQLPLVISQTYDFLFWADNANLDATLGKFSDKYYNTQDLTAVKIMDETTGNLDEKDAFFAADHNVLFTSTAALKEYTLTRPFAQVNIVTTDLLNIKGADDQTLALNELWPATISVNYTTEFHTQFNVSTGVASEPKVINRKAEAVYGCADAKAYNTLNMDYIFVNEVEGEGTTPFAITKAEITSKNGKVITILEGAENIPMKRNYRTNILGSFLTDPQDFKVTVNPLWLSPDFGDQLPAPAADPQGCTVTEDPVTGETVATYEEGNPVVVVPEGVTKFITNPENPTSAGGAYNMNITSLTMPSTIEFFEDTYTSFCKNIETLTWTCNPDHDFQIDTNGAMYGTGENKDVVTLNVTGLPKSFKMVKYNYGQQKYVEYTSETPNLNFGDGHVRTLIINLPAGWIAKGYPYKFIAGDRHNCEVYEDGVLVSKSTAAGTPVTVFE